MAQGAFEPPRVGRVARRDAGWPESMLDAREPRAGAPVTTRYATARASLCPRLDLRYKCRITRR
jgi:hypothetical protein